MSNATSELAVVSAPLPLVDRRALSQAWYSALHLVPHQDTARPAAALHNVDAARGDAPKRTHVKAAEKHTAPLSMRVPFRALAPRMPERAIDRRSAPAPLARKVVRLLERKIPAELPASVAVRTESGRVQLLVRREGGRLRVIALCPEALREGVERAVAHACYALSGAGMPRC